MKIASDIRIYIINDDASKADLLQNKLLEYNAQYHILIFNTGNELINHLKSAFTLGKYHYVVLDYFLQTKNDEDSLNGQELIHFLGEKYPKIKIIVYSAYETDDETHKTIQQLVKEPNVIDYVKKSEYAHSTIQNIFRFYHAQVVLAKKKRRFQWALALFLGVLLIIIFRNIANMIFTA